MSPTKRLAAVLGRHLAGASRGDGCVPLSAEGWRMPIAATAVRPITSLARSQSAPHRINADPNWGSPHQRLCFSCGAQAAKAAEPDESHCWKCTHRACKQTMPHFFCKGCKIIQPPPEASAEALFAVMGEEPRFDLDVGKLEQKYKQLQRSLHPDKFATSPELERSYSAEYSSLVNQSYNVLRDPLQRANLLLKLEGYSRDEDDEQTLDDPELLMETMEAREAVEEASTHERLVELLDSNRTQQRACKERMSQAFRDKDGHGAVAAVQRLTYLYRISEEIVKKM